jgi:hypothetical protein
VKILELFIIIIIIILVTFIQVIYDYIRKTIHVSRVCSVAALLYVQFVLHIMLFHRLNMFGT